MKKININDLYLVRNGYNNLYSLGIKNIKFGPTIKEVDVKNDSEIYIGINLFGSSHKVSSILFNDYSQEAYFNSKTFSKLEVGIGFIKKIKFALEYDKKFQRALNLMTEGSKYVKEEKDANAYAKMVLESCLIEEYNNLKNYNEEAIR
ncbi:MAG: hypothetical protein E7359_01740 [Clostridiales bacterium]|nr:hypothetical protein [Clostridiales bacterium]